jgi:hypothetical protein
MLSLLALVSPIGGAMMADPLLHESVGDMDGGVHGHLPVPSASLFSDIVMMSY